MDIVVIDQQMMLAAYWNELKAKHNIEDNRRRENVVWRHAFSVAATQQTSLALQKIGRIMGKDHATIIHARKQHAANYNYDSYYKQCFLQVNAHLAELMSTYNTEVNRAMTKTLSVSPDFERLIDQHQNELERVNRNAEQKYQALLERYNIVSAELKKQLQRTNQLNERVKRLQNLV
jgi:chromosome segregation ATPase